MTNNQQDTVGQNFLNTNAGTSGTLNGLSQIGGNLNYQYPYTTYSYYPDYSLTSRVAELEGEVKVLREMLAAMLVSGQRAPAKKTRRSK